MGLPDDPTLSIHPQCTPLTILCPSAVPDILHSCALKMIVCILFVVWPFPLEYKSHEKLLVHY